jgi:hypothetical protein
VGVWGWLSSHTKIQALTRPPPATGHNIIFFKKKNIYYFLIKQ